MATFRSNLLRLAISGAVIFGSLISLGASFAPLIPLTSQVLDPSEWYHAFLTAGKVPDLSSARPVLSRGKMLDRLEEWVQTHRAVSVSA